MFKHSYSRTPKYERQGPTKCLRSQEEDVNVRDVDLIKEVFLALSSSDKITCFRQLCEHISETQRTELVGYFGSLVGDDMERTRCSSNASHMKEITNFSAFDVSTYIKQQPTALVNFICAVSKVSLERVNTNQRLAYQIAVVCEQLIRLSMPHYVGPVSFLQNLNVLAITSSKLALNIIGSSIPGGKYNTVCNWFAEQGSSPLQCPTGDIVIMFDNEQIIGRTWSIKPQNKIKTSIITNVAALPLTAETSLQKRSDLHPRKWLNDEAKKAHADGIIIGQGDNKHERIHYQQLFLFIEAALEDVINEQNKEDVCTDKIDVIVEARRKHRLFRVCPDVACQAEVPRSKRKCTVCGGSMKTPTSEDGQGKGSSNNPAKVQMVNTEVLAGVDDDLKAKPNKRCNLASERFENVPSGHTGVKHKVHLLDPVFVNPNSTENIMQVLSTVRNPLLLCPLVLAQDGGTRSGQKCLHRDFSATVLFWVIMLGEAIFDIKHDF